MKTQLYYGVSLLRSGLYAMEGLLLPMADAWVTKKFPHTPLENPKVFFRARRKMRELLYEDAQAIAEGLYPAEVLTISEPYKSWQEHFLRLPKLFQEAIFVSRQRYQKQTKKFRQSAKALAEKKPDYYRRNFHFQRDGYLSKDSADIYDHQVEILFAGAADAMRRLLLRPLREQFGPGKGKGLKFLELACGAGSATKFLSLAFPEAEIVAIDLSEPYIEKARAELGNTRTKFLVASAEDLPFKKEQFDAVVSVFLFHEVPLQVRQKILAEATRVLKPKGLMAHVDSLQKNDADGLEWSLQEFPRFFHEPFYKNYTIHPLEDLLAEQPLSAPKRKKGFFSKLVWATKLQGLAGFGQKKASRPVKKGKKTKKSGKA